MCVKKCKEIFILVKTVMGGGTIIMWTSIHRSMCSVTTAAPSSSQAASSSSNHIGDLLHTYVTGNQDGPGLGWTRPAMVYPASLCFHFVSTYLTVCPLGGFPFPFSLSFLKTLPVWGGFNFYGGWSLFWVGERKEFVCARTRRMCVVRGQEDDLVGTRGQGLEAQSHMQCPRLKPLI